MKPMKAGNRNHCQNVLFLTNRLHYDTYSSPSNLVKRSHNMPFSTAASLKGHSVVSVRSEGSTTLSKTLQMRRFSRNVPAPLRRTDTNQSHALDIPVMNLVKAIT